MISKKLFCDTLARMEVLQRTEDQVNLVFEENAINDNVFSYGDAFVLILELLTETMYDKDNGWIYFFAIDLNYGKEYKLENGIRAIDNKNNIIPMYNSEQLYQYLVEQAMDMGFI
jgi:hypothetical protein